jgi:hypothetical protein
MQAARLPGEELSKVSSETAGEWMDEEWSLHGRKWKGNMDGNPYGLENMAKALARYRSGCHSSSEDFIK